MKTTPHKDMHVGLRLEAADLEHLDELCKAVGGASRSRVLRRVLLFLRSLPSDYTDQDGKPIEANANRREFIAWFRRLDDAIIDDMVKGIDAGMRKR